jgi:RNA polymerase sigma factor (sigma-70 family)
LRICPPSDAAAEGESATVTTVVDHLFRREAGRLVAILTRRFGPEHLQLAEDVVQDALGKAMQTWPFTGIPSNPTAWILQTARNRALDQTRRSRIWEGKQAKLLPLFEDLDPASRAQAPLFEDEIEDSQLRMMFVCCHPGLAPDAQVALTLKILCGFGEREIAAAFLTNEAAIAKRLTRARQYLRDKRITTDLPSASELAPRVAVVQQALYLLFNEGYKASDGPTLLREDLCGDAIRLGVLLAAQPFATRPETHALLALMYFNNARLPTRMDEGGLILTLDRQDRSRWDQEGIRRGMAHLEASGGGTSVSRYHIEAGIAACHALAPSEAETNWPQILGFYDDLLSHDASPVVALNRAVALAKVKGAAAGLKAIEKMARRDSLENYHLLHAVCGHLRLQAGDRAQALVSFRRAYELATLPVEREHLSRRMEEALGLAGRS